MMTIPFNNKIAIISHSGINLTEDLLGDSDKHLKETENLFSIILNNSIAFLMSLKIKLFILYQN